MQAIINGFEQLIGNIRAIFTIISNLFSMIGHTMVYIEKITLLLFGYIGQIPPWISGFMMITLVVSFLYIIIGRVGGKN